MLYTTMVVKDKEYKLRISARSCVDLEKKLGENPLNVLVAATDENKIPTLSSFLMILHAAIQQYQHGITLDDVYDIYDEFVDEGHGIMDLVPIIYEVFKVSGYCGQAEEAKESEAKKRINGGHEPTTWLELFDEILLPQALRCGITLFNFWDMTLAEITQVIKAYNEDYKVKLQENYSNAVMIASFVLQGLNGKKIPKFNELYPNLVQEDEDNTDQAMQLYKEQFMDFANRHNKLNYGGKL